MDATQTMPRPVDARDTATQEGGSRHLDPRRRERFRAAVADYHRACDAVKALGRKARNEEWWMIDREVSCELALIDAILDLDPTFPEADGMPHDHGRHWKACGVTYRGRRYIARAAGADEAVAEMYGDEGKEGQAMALTIIDDAWLDLD